MTPAPVTENTGEKKRRVLRHILCPALFGLVFSPVSVALASLFEVAPLPGIFHSMATFVFLFSLSMIGAWLLVALLSSVATLLTLCTREGRKKKLYVAVAIVWFVSWASIFAYVPLRSLRTSLLERIPARGQPVIDALERYHAALGAYPADLQTLVPDYIAEIPPTRLLICPEFHYKRAAPEDDFTGYELSVRTQGFNYDVVFYWPGENYSAFRAGQKIERYGNWAHYVFD